MSGINDDLLLHQILGDEAAYPPLNNLSVAQLRDIFASLDQGIQVWGRDGALALSAGASEDQFGHVAPLMLEQRLVDWLGNFQDDKGMQISAASGPLTSILQDKAAQVEFSMHTHPAASGGQSRWFRVRMLARYADDGEQTGLITLTREFTETRRQAEALQQQAFYDALTGLPNRVLLSDRLERAMTLHRRSNQTLAVCLLDLDGFKAVNDHYGHSAGDRLLREIAGRLQAVLREEDTAGRLGGDEFVLIIGGMRSMRQYEPVIRRVLEAVSRPVAVEGGNASVSASIGVTLFPNDDVDADQLLRHADQQMYKAKQAGKNCFSVFDPTLESKARANQALIRKIETALERREFRLYFQPKVDCRRDELAGVEALIRWQHPILGARSPGEFLPLIEHEPVSLQLGEWVIGEALRHAELLAEAGMPQSISVNVSAYQLLHPEFPERLDELLIRYPLMARYLEIEILETAALADIQRIADLLARFHPRGITFSLDDFGTGFSSLVHLKRVPSDVLKIDQTFVRDMLDDPGDLAIVRGVIGLADAFRRKVVAEGVETSSHVHKLLELGCDVMQGYCLARPMPFDDLLVWLGDPAAPARWRTTAT